MGSPAITPPPGATPDQGPFGGSPQVGAVAAPAPAQPNPKATQAVSLVHQIISAGRALAQQFPATAPIVRQMNDLVQQLQMKIVQSQPPGESAAPPV